VFYIGEKMMLAEKLKKCRLEKQYSQGDVADQLNISRQAISKWENGWTTPDLDNLKLLSQLYDISIDELLNESITDFSKTNELLNTIEHNVEKKNSAISNEVLIFMSLSIVSCILPPIGIIVNAWLLLKTRNKKNYLLVKVLCIICILICIYNNVIIVNNLFFQYGQGNAELIQ